MKNAIDVRMFQTQFQTIDRDLQTILLRDNPWIQDQEALGRWLASHLPAISIPRSVLASEGGGWHLPGQDPRSPHPSRGRDS
jgi:hypothetical protein